MLELAPPVNDADRRRRARRAVAHLRKTDARLGTIIAHVGPHRPKVVRDPYVCLVHSILQQQVSMASAAAVYRRVRESCPRKRVSPRTLLELGTDILRGVGVSRQKSQYLLGLSEAFTSRRLTRAKLARMTDEEVVAATTELKGIGRWTAEMLLIFCLERPDVWPVDDLGLRKAVQRHLGAANLPVRSEMEPAGDAYRPYRTYASWYLWRSLEGPLMPGVPV